MLKLTNIILIWHIFRPECSCEWKFVCPLINNIPSTYPSIILKVRLGKKILVRKRARSGLSQEK